MTILRIAPDRSDLVAAALCHDLHEVELGDIPYTVKRDRIDIDLASSKQENEFAEKYGLPTAGDTEGYAMLKWADMFELLLFASREYSMGNKTMYQTIGIARMVLESNHPNDLARELYESVPYVL